VLHKPIERSKVGSVTLQGNAKKKMRSTGTSSYGKFRAKEKGFSEKRRVRGKGRDLKQNDPVLCPLEILLGKRKPIRKEEKSKDREFIERMEYLRPRVNSCSHHEIRKRRKNTRTLRQRKKTSAGALGGGRIVSFDLSAGKAQKPPPQSSEKKLLPKRKKVGLPKLGGGEEKLPSWPSTNNQEGGGSPKRVYSPERMRK